MSLMIIISILFFCLIICDRKYSRTKNMTSVACQADLEPVSTVVIHPSNELSITSDEIL